MPLYPAVIASLTCFLGLWFMWPGIGLSRMQDMLTLYGERRKTDVGTLANPPLLVQYMDSRTIQLFWFFLPIGVNLIWWFGFDVRDLWDWSGIGFGGLLAGWWFQHRRGKFFKAEWETWLGLTEKGNTCFGGVINYPNVRGCYQREGFYVSVVRWSTETESNEEHSAFVQWGTERRYPISEIIGRPVLIFERPYSPESIEDGPFLSTKVQIVGYQRLPETVQVFLPMMTRLHGSTSSASSCDR
ncbi:MAG: hypothetical protein WBO92_01785 [Candidatus Moraniibacteriota bacterium]